MNLSKITNEIIILAQIGDYTNCNDIFTRRSFGFGDSAINFLNENCFKYDALIHQAFNSDDEIKSSYTLEKYEQLLINYLENSIRNSSTLKEGDTKLFHANLKSDKKKYFYVFRDIYGIYLKNPNTPLNLGRYTVYNFHASRKDIELKTKLNPEHIWFGEQPEYLIECKAEARHFEKAVEIVDQQFERFELILKYIIGNPTSRFEVGIINHTGRKYHRAYIFSADGQYSNSSNYQVPIEPIPLDEPYFLNEEAGYKYIWELASKSELNKFQKRIFLAIDWIGQSIAETLPQSAFLKAAIALEIIFTYNEKTIITPSILNQISESTALIWGESTEERLRIEKKVKELYSLRSAIVHSGNKDIGELDYHDMLDVSRSVIKKLLTSNELKTITSVEELYNLLKKTKYSCSPL